MGGRVGEPDGTQGGQPILATADHVAVAAAVRRSSRGQPAAGSGRGRVLVDQVFLKDDQVVGVGGVPADADDVVADVDGEVDELALVVQALAADVLVAVVLGPGLLGFLKLPGDAVPAEVGQDAAEPVVEHAGLEFKADPEAHRPVVHAGEQRQDVVAAHEAALEKIHLALGAEHGVVQLHGLRKHSLVGDDDVGLGHGLENLR